MKERMRLIKDKMLLMRKDEAGDKARVDFIQRTKYDLNLLEKLIRARDEVQHFPNESFGELAVLCDMYGSDKGSCTEEDSAHPYSPLPAHTYTDIYEILFRGRRDNVKNVFECGIGTNDVTIDGNMTANGKPGASLRVWRDYFGNAVVWGADIDKKVLFEEDRIRTAYMDQTNPEDIKTFFDQTGVKSFDIMIDDGLHTFEAARCLFENVTGGGMNYLSNDGIYVIEDLLFDYIKEFYLYMRNKKEFVVKYLLMDAPHRFANNLIVIKKVSS
jgi:hypothetical protein